MYYSKTKSDTFLCIILCIFTVFLCTLILIFNTASTAGVKSGLIYCSDILIPSLFPFMILSSFIVGSGISSKLEKILSPITKTLFNLPGSTGAIIIISIIGGYPIGARGIKTLYENKQITSKQAEQLLLFCIGAGPAFVITAVGEKMLGNSQIGIIIFISITLATFIIGIVSKMIFKNNVDSAETLNKSQNTNISLSKALVDSCNDASTGIISLCSFVILFSSVIAVMNQSEFSKFISDLLLDLGVPKNYSNSLIYSILEVTGGCINATNIGSSIEFITFSIGWAGLCVHFQVFSCVDKIPFSKSKFFIFRLLHGFIAAFICHIILLIFPITQQTFSTFNFPSTYSLSSNLSSCFSLIFLCVCFLFIVTPKHLDFYNKKC